MITELNERSREIFRLIVDAYLDTGQPVGSRTLSKTGVLGLSPASIRNTMADLEEAGLLHAPHSSAGRLPTERGLRLYVDGLMEVGALSAEEQQRIEAECRVRGVSLQDMVEQASSTLSHLSACASLVLAPKAQHAIKHVQFVPLSPGRILVVLVLQNGMVENRVMEVSDPFPASALIQASNFLSARLSGQTIEHARARIEREIADNRAQIDSLTRDLVHRGLALPLGQGGGRIIVRGQARLFEDVKALADLERVRQMLAYLEEQDNMLHLLDSLDGAQGVQIFIGADSTLFNQSGWSLIVSPFRGGQEKIIGAIGVIGPTRLDYDRIIPMVDYTSKVISRLVDRA